MPVMLPYDKLIAKYANELTIRVNGKFVTNPEKKSDHRIHKRGRNITQTRESHKRKTRPKKPNKRMSTKATESVRDCLIPTPRPSKERNQPSLQKKIPDDDIPPRPPPIDTEGFIDGSFVSFIPEFGQRLSIQPVPRDPLDLCRNFKIHMQDCGVYNFDED